MSAYKVEDQTKAEMISIVKEETTGCWDANADWRNGSYPPYLWRKPMAQVTYRGVKYDTKTVRPSNKKEVVLSYRGHKFVKQLQTA